MFFKRMTLIGILGGLALGVSACSTGYGYSGVSVGAGSGFYGDPYYAAGGYAPGYYGWYDDFYYPGTGGYVYDRYRQARPWTGVQRRYWEQRRQGLDRRDLRADWRGFGQYGGRDDRGDGRWRDGRGDRAFGNVPYRGPRVDGRPAYRSDGPGVSRSIPRAGRMDGGRPSRPDRGARQRR